MLNEVARREISSSPALWIRRERSRVAATCSAASVSDTTGRIAVRVARRESTTASRMPARASNPSAQRSVKSVPSTSTSERAAKIATPSGPLLTSTRTRAPSITRSARKGERSPAATCLSSWSSPSAGGTPSSVVPAWTLRITFTYAGAWPVSSVVSAGSGPGPLTLAMSTWLWSELSIWPCSVSLTIQ